MSSMNCPYCEIKEIAKLKTVYEAIKPTEGTCPDCGAYLDGGQHSVRVNSYKQIYEGAVRLMQRITDEFNYLLDFMDVDVEEYMDEIPKISISSGDIVYALFLENYGGTTKGNFMNAIGINDESKEFEEFEIKRMEYEP